MVKEVGCAPGGVEGREEVRRQVRIGGVSWWSCKVPTSVQTARKHNYRDANIWLDEKHWVLQHGMEQIQRAFQHAEVVQVI